MKNNKILVKNILVNNDRVEYVLEIIGDVKKYFNQDTNMFIEYGENIESVPKGVLVIPLLSNILPIAWFSNCEIIVDEIDKNFYECIENIKQGYIDMHTNATLKGSLLANSIIDYSYDVTNNTATFFSGGVDSLATLITRIDERPNLITLWGSDIKLTDEYGWKRVKDEVTDFGKRNELDNLLIKSSFRTFINEGALDSDYSSIMNDGWWHGAQHGIGLIGHVAPYAYIHKLKTVYIPSTNTIHDGKVSCASYPTIDDKVELSSTRVFHEGFENNRQDKIRIICDYVKKYDQELLIRVCWESEGGGNCCKCEKCSRTIMGIIAEHLDPNKFGFNVTDSIINNIKININKKWIFSQMTLTFWSDIQNKFNENKQYWENYSNLNWILYIDFNKINRKKINRNKRRKICKNIWSVLKYQIYKMKKFLQKN